MKAAVFYGPHQPLRIEEREIPRPGPGEILVKVAACGVCHSDLEYIELGVPTFKKPPVILGHEPSGIVEEVGPGVTEFAPGARVILSAVTGCGQCLWCRSGRENICSRMTMLGNSIDGAYAEFVKVPARMAFAIPEEVSLREGCIIADAISTPFHAVKNQARVKAGDVVVVIGCGGVGLNAVQIASALGAHVIAVDIVEKKLQWARELGAAEVINAGQADVPKKVRELTGGGVDVALEVIGNPETIRQAYGCLRPGGRLCVVGYCPGDFSLQASRLMMRELEIVGSCGCPPQEYPRIIRMVADGQIKVKPLVTHYFSLEEVDKAFEVMKKGESIRSVLVIGDQA